MRKFFMKLWVPVLLSVASCDNKEVCSMGEKLEFRGEAQKRFDDADLEVFELRPRAVGLHLDTAGFLGDRSRRRYQLHGAATCYKGAHPQLSGP